MVGSRIRVEIEHKHKLKECEMLPRKRKRGQGFEDWLGSSEGQRQMMGTSLNAQTWIDVRAVATVDRFLQQQGYSVRGMSELLRTMTEIVLNSIRIEAPEIVMKDMTEALGYLSSRGYSLGQLETNLQHAKKLELALRAEAYQSGEIEKVVNRTAGTTCGPGFQPTEDDLAELAELEKAQQDRDKQEWREKFITSQEVKASIAADEARLEAERLARKAAAQEAQMPTESTTTTLVGSDVETVEEAVARRAREAKEEKEKMKEYLAEQKRKREEIANASRVTEEVDSGTQPSGDM